MGQHCVMLAFIAMCLASTRLQGGRLSRHAGSLSTCLAGPAGPGRPSISPPLDKGARSSRRSPDPLRIRRRAQWEAAGGAEWLPLPELPRLGGLGRRASTLGAAALAAWRAGRAPAWAWQSQPWQPPANARSTAGAKGWPVIPIWPTFDGGRVVPVTPSDAEADPLLLLAHHRHSFDPGDATRPLFRNVGAALGLPYLPKEGFSVHPHRGFEIATYILDGSDGFRHRDSLGGQCTYRGGSVQWMRAGAGVLHEEMWETQADRRTSIELFQIWINLPRRLKMSPPHIQMLGSDWGIPFEQAEVADERGQRTHVRIIAGDAHGVQGPYQFATPLVLAHARLEPGATWHAPSSPDDSVLVYAREGTALLPLRGSSGGWTPLAALQSATLQGRGPVVITGGDLGADVLYFAGKPHREPVARGGPIVMNHDWEVAEAFRELQAGTFLN